MRETKPGVQNNSAMKPNEIGSLVSMSPVKATGPLCCVQNIIQEDY
jgi:hypothetical protein